MNPDNKFTNKSLQNRQDLSFVRISHRKGLKMQKN